MSQSDTQNLEKKIAGEKAAEFVSEGTVIGLGTGSTVYFAIRKLGEMVENGLDIKAVSTSHSTTELTKSFKIKTVSINDVDTIDLTIDGADEVDNNFNGIKGGGGALLFEKIVALSSKKNIWAVDSGKMVDKLGMFPLPVEVIPFGYKRVFDMLEEINFKPSMRKNEGKFFLTDSGNYIFDLYLQKISNPMQLDKDLKSISGIVETGLFIDIADTIIIGKSDKAEVLTK